VEVGYKMGSRCEGKSEGYVGKRNFHLRGYGYARA